MGKGERLTPFIFSGYSGESCRTKGGHYQSALAERQEDPMPWILSKIRVVNIGLFICVLAPCLLVASSAAHESPEAVIQLFYKALREGKYAEAQKYLTNAIPDYIKKRRLKWAAVADRYTKERTLQTVEVGKVSTYERLRSDDDDEAAVMFSAMARFADGSVQKLRIGLAMEEGVWKINWIGKLKVKQTFRDYVVSIYSPEFFTYISSEFLGFLEIFQGGHRVMFSILGPSEHFQLVQTDKANAMGKDITGNGIPNLVVSRDSGGSAGYATYNIFEIGQKFRKIATIDDYLGIEFTDLDGDSKLEIVVFDHGILSLAECMNCYRPPKVILRYQDGAYRIAADLMHKPFPLREDLVRRAQQVRDDASWYWRKAGFEKNLVPESLLNTMLELIYTGHPNHAWRFLNMAWPPDVSGKDAWLHKFRANLKESKYWPLDSKRAYFVP